MQDTADREIQVELIQVLRRGARKARFVTEVARQLQRAKVSAEALERALAELEAAGRVLVREQYCADPHMVGTDLRIVALLRTPGIDAGPADDPLGLAIDDIEAVWGRWLADYLSNHRCG